MRLKVWLLTIIGCAFSFHCIAQAQGIHIVHCLKGCPTGTPDTNHLIVREIYALSNNKTTKFADWVAYRVTKETIGLSQDLNLTRRADPDLEEQDTLEPEV